MKTAVGDKKDNVVFAFVARDVSRCESLGFAAGGGQGKYEKGKYTTEDEFKVVKKYVTAPFFFVIDDGEIGHPVTGKPAAAKRDQINVCVISRLKK